MNNFTETAIQLRGLSKTYRHNNPFLKIPTPALYPMDLDVPLHQAFGLIGLNGAGKTTLVKIILGLLTPTSGKAEVLGGDIRDRTVRQRVGYLPELPYFPRSMTGRELVGYYGSLYGLRGGELHRRTDEVLDLVRLTRAASMRLNEYSKGMQQRVGLAQALVGKPDLLICDEPVTGLDPVGYKEVREIFLQLKGQGTTLFFNTHVLSEVEKVCDWVGILHEGRLKRVARVSEVLAERLEMDYWVEVENADAARIPSPAWRESVQKSGGFQVPGRDLTETLDDLARKAIRVTGVRPLSSLVESFFLRTIGRENDLLFSNRPEVHS